MNLTASSACLALLIGTATALPATAAPAVRAAELYVSPAGDDGNAVDLGDNGAGGSGNSWDSGDTWDLQSTDPTTVTGPRNPDGSIPSSDFLVPANGEDVGARF